MYSNHFFPFFFEKVLVFQQKIVAVHLILAAANQKCILKMVVETFKSLFGSTAHIFLVIRFNSDNSIINNLFDLLKICSLLLKIF